MSEYLTDHKIDEIFQLSLEFENTKRLNSFLKKKEEEFFELRDELWEALLEKVEERKDLLWGDEYSHMVTSNHTLKDEEEQYNYLHAFIIQKREELFQYKQELKHISKAKHLFVLLDYMQDKSRRISNLSAIRKNFIIPNLLKVHNKIQSIVENFSDLDEQAIKKLNPKEISAFVQLYFSLGGDEISRKQTLLYEIEGKDITVYIARNDIDLFKIIEKRFRSKIWVHDYDLFQKRENMFWGWLYKHHGRNFIAQNDIIKRYIRVITRKSKLQVLQQLKMEYSFGINEKYRENLINIFSNIHKHGGFKAKLLDCSTAEELVDLLLAKDYRPLKSIRLGWETSVVVYLFDKMKEYFKNSEINSLSIEKSGKVLIPFRFNPNTTRDLSKFKFIQLKGSTYRQGRLALKKYCNNNSKVEGYYPADIDAIFARYLK
ncbi:MAG: hypothetical protein JST29_01530 [Bacteroidetes bacterium]|nr:hypothetical protein [Bacteroidota bacterium]